MIRTSSSQSGFTAVELLITLFVAAAFIVAGYQLFNVVIKDGGNTRAESRAGNIAYDYLRRYSDSAVAPCTPSAPLTNQAVSIEGITNSQISVVISCPQPSEAPTLSKVEAVLTYGTGTDANTVRYATFVDKSKGATPVADFTDNLIARWKFNGDTKADAGGIDGILYGAIGATNNSGTQNMALGFSGTGQYVEAPSTFGITDRSVSVSLWVNMASASVSGQFIKIGGGGGFGIGVGNGNFDNTNPGPEIIGLFEGIRWIDTNTALGTGWRHLVLVLGSTGTPSIYRDGVLVGTYAGTNTQLPTNNLIHIGGRPNSSPTRWVSGSIDDVRIYRKDLSGAEVLQIFTQGPK